MKGLVEGKVVKGFIKVNKDMNFFTNLNSYNIISWLLSISRFLEILCLYSVANSKIISKIETPVSYNFVLTGNHKSNLKLKKGLFVHSGFALLWICFDMRRQMFRMAMAVGFIRHFLGNLSLVFYPVLI